MRWPDKQTFWILALLLSLSIGLYIFLNMPVRAYPDTEDYLRISRTSFTTKFVSDRPPLIPIIFGWFSGDGTGITWFQFVLSGFCWSYFSITLFSSLKTEWLKYVAASMVLLIALSKDVFFWNRVLLTESVSLSTFVLALATWIRCLRKPDKSNLRILVLPAVTSTLWALTRDTNAWALLSISFFTLLACFLSQNKSFFVCATILLITIFGVENYFAEIGGRWKLGLPHVIGKRILTNPDSTQYFVDHGMPMNPEIARYAGQWGDLPLVTASEPWFSTNAKAVYEKYLLSRPLQSLLEPIINWKRLFSTVYDYSGRSGPPMLQTVYSRIVYPEVSRLALLILFDLVVCWILFRNKLLFGKEAVLLTFAGSVVAASYLVAFVTWHADAMEVTRHSFGFVVQFRMGIWLLCFFGLDLMCQNRLVPHRNRISSSVKL